MKIQKNLFNEPIFNERIELKIEVMNRILNREFILNNIDISVNRFNPNTLNFFSCEKIWSCELFADAGQGYLNYYLYRLPMNVSLVSINV